MHLQMRILIAIPWLPWPLDGGGNVAVVNSLACLQQDHEFTFVCPVYGEDGVRGAQELQSHLPRVRVRGINCGSAAAVKRPGQVIIHNLRKTLRHSLRLFLPEPSKVAAAPAEDIPEYPFAPLPPKFVSAVLAELETGFDLVQLEFVQMLSLGAALPADIPKLFAPPATICLSRKASRGPKIRRVCSIPRTNDASAREGVFKVV